MKRIFGARSSSATDDKRTVVSATIVASGDFCTFRTTTLRANNQVAECRTCTFTIIRTACAASLCFDTSLSCRMSLMSHDLLICLSLFGGQIKCVRQRISDVYECA